MSSEHSRVPKKMYVFFILLRAFTRLAANVVGGWREKGCGCAGWLLFTQLTLFQKRARLVTREDLLSMQLVLDQALVSIHAPECWKHVIR